MKITRRDLYSLVWSRPILQVSAALGISDVALAKNCRRHNIPTPPRGYWQKLKSGCQVVRPYLPDRNHNPIVREGVPESSLKTLVCGELIFESIEEPQITKEQVSSTVGAASSGIRREVVPVTKSLKMESDCGFDMTHGALPVSRSTEENYTNSNPSLSSTRIASMVLKLTELRNLLILTHELDMQLVREKNSEIADTLRKWISVARVAVQQLDPVRELFTNERIEVTEEATHSALDRRSVSPIQRIDSSYR